MAVTDWNTDGSIDSTMSARLSQAKFTVLIDEEFRTASSKGQETDRDNH
jgi:hypothetical protein